MTDDEIDTPSPAPPAEADSGLADLASAVVQRERDLAADRARRRSLEIWLAAAFLLLITVVLALLAGALLAIAIVCFVLDYRDMEWTIDWRTPLHRYTIAGPTADVMIAALLFHFASLANRTRKRLLRRPPG
jgi:hypothetical protein